MVAELCCGISSTPTKATSLRVEPRDAGTYKSLFSRASTMRADLGREMYTQRLEVLNLVAKEYRLEPGSVGHMRPMKVGLPIPGVLAMSRVEITVFYHLEIVSKGTAAIRGPGPARRTGVS